MCFLLSGVGLGRRRNAPPIYGRSPYSTTDTVGIEPAPADAEPSIRAIYSLFWAGDLHRTQGIYILKLLAG